MNENTNKKLNKERNIGRVKMVLVIEDISESEQQKQERQKLESERQKQQEEFLKPYLENFCAIIMNHVHAIHPDYEIVKFLRENTIGSAVENTDRYLHSINTNASGHYDAEDNYIAFEDFLEQAFLLSCVIDLEYKKQEKLEELENQKLEELEDLENAKPIFEMLKMEVLKGGGGFDEWTISVYIKDMLEYARKHKVDLGTKETSGDTKET